MSTPDDEPKKWLLDFFAITGGKVDLLNDQSDPSPNDETGATGEAAAPIKPLITGAQYVSAGAARVGTIDIKDYGGQEAPDQTLPQGDTDPELDVVDHDSDKTIRMKKSAILKSPYYVDNAAFKMTAKPVNLTTLEVKTMDFTSSSGETFSVDLSDVVYGSKMPALSFVRKQKIFYPVTRDGDIVFDKVNTPNIVRFAEWVNQEIDKRRKLRIKITSATFLFMIALAELGAAVGAPEFESPAGGGSIRVGGKIKPPIRSPEEPAPIKPSAPKTPTTAEETGAAAEAAKGAGAMSRVGRWMSRAEYAKMKATGRVQADAAGQHRVAYPATADAYKAAPKGDIYVEYDVPTSSLGPGGTDGWRTISGPGSPQAKLAAKRGQPIPELPEFKNLSEPIQVK